MNAKRLATIALAACSLFALAACAKPVATADVPAPAVTVTETQTERAPAPDPEPVEEPVGDDDQYLYLLRDSSPWFDDIDDYVLVDLGHSLCDAIDRGATINEIAEAANNSGVPLERAAELTAAAIVIYCPWNKGIAS